MRSPVYLRREVLGAEGWSAAQNSAKSPWNQHLGGVPTKVLVAKQRIHYMLSPMLQKVHICIYDVMSSSLFSCQERRPYDTLLLRPPLSYSLSGNEDLFELLPPKLVNL